MNNYMRFSLLFLINSSLTMQEKEGDLLVEKTEEGKERGSDYYNQAKKICNDLYKKHPERYKYKLQEILKKVDEPIKTFLSCMVPDEVLGDKGLFKAFFNSRSYGLLLLLAEKHSDMSFYAQLLNSTQHLVGSPHK